MNEIERVLSFLSWKKLLILLPILKQENQINGGTELMHLCVILAFSHDLDKLADYLNEHRILIPKIPSYSSE